MAMFSTHVVYAKITFEKLAPIDYFEKTFNSYATLRRYCEIWHDRQANDWAMRTADFEYRCPSGEILDGQITLGFNFSKSDQNKMQKKRQMFSTKDFHWAEIVAGVVWEEHVWEEHLDAIKTLAADIARDCSGTVEYVEVRDE